MSPDTLDRTRSPKAGNIRPFDFPAVLSDRLDNGLDLRIAHLGPAGEGVLTGILARRSGAPVGRVPAYLVVGDRVVRRTLSDEAGQFEVEVDLDRSLELWIDVAGDEHIAVTVDPLQ